VSSFTRLFFEGGDDGDEEERGRPWARRAPSPPWLGPPEDELGVVVQLALVVGRSENGVVALRHATVYSAGVSFHFVAVGRDLRRAQSNRLLHDQHLFDPEEEPSDGFLRIGLELPDGRRVSNLGGRMGRRARFASSEEKPGVAFFEHGGGGGSGGDGRVSVRPAYWLWPLPDSGAIRVFCEWPVLELALSSAELDVRPLVEARAHVVSLWPPG